VVATSHGPRRRLAGSRLPHASFTRKPAGPKVPWHPTCSGLGRVCLRPAYGVRYRSASSFFFFCGLCSNTCVSFVPWWRPLVSKVAFCRSIAQTQSVSLGLAILGTGDSARSYPLLYRGAPYLGRLATKAAIPLSLRLYVFTPRAPTLPRVPPVPNSYPRFASAIYNFSLSYSASFSLSPFFYQPTYRGL